MTLLHVAATIALVALVLGAAVRAGPRDAPGRTLSVRQAR